MAKDSHAWYLSIPCQSMSRGGGGFEYLRILPGRSKVVLARLVRLFDLVAVPHWPEECSFGKHLDFCGVFTCELLEKRRVLVIPCGRGWLCTCPWLDNTVMSPDSPVKSFIRGQPPIDE